ncbi:MAG: hypothetical protein II825_04415 [Paludibacteraceae bacterium]|nr:hypothetical protein [Paludibacteraceae bacterium]
MKKIFFILLLSIGALGAYAQNLEGLSSEELIERIKWFHQCFNELSLPYSHEETITLSSGKTINMLAQSDYDRSAFVSVDKLLEDVQLWKQSPYLWQMNHSKNNSAIMDGKDLSNWEINSFNQIAQSYFENCVSTYHIAAHGLVDYTGKATNNIKIGGQTLNAEETAELIIRSMQNSFYHIINAENQPFVVVVHCCHTADGENNFSSQLSKELAKYIPNVSVVGAPDVVYCEERDGKYTEFVTIDQEEAQKQNPKKLKWKVYKDGKNTDQGKYNYLETVSSIQKVLQSNITQ